MEQDLRTAVDSIRKKCLQLRDQLVRDRGEARKKLVELSDWSCAATKTLHTVISKVTFDPVCPPQSLQGSSHSSSSVSG